MPSRLPVFAALASPSTPVTTVGVAGCVTPVQVSPANSPAARRGTRRERVLEQRIDALKERLRIALLENESLKAALAASHDDDGTGDAIDHALHAYAPCTDGRHDEACGRMPRKRGGRGRGGKAKKPSMLSVAAS